MPDDTSTITPPAVVTPPPPDPPKPHVMASSLPDEALKARLDSAKATGQKELLTSLGAQSPDEIKAALEMYRTAEAAKKTEADKLAAEMLARQTAEQQTGKYKTALEAYKAQELSKLTPEQLNAVNLIAGDDLAIWVNTLAALRPTWSTQPSPPNTSTTPPTTTAAPPTVPVQPANTAPSGGAPPPSGSVSPFDAKAYHAALLERNPIVAAQFAEQHRKEIYG
jgi:hypothetical protein